VLRLLVAPGLLLLREQEHGCCRCAGGVCVFGGWVAINVISAGLRVERWLVAVVSVLEGEGRRRQQLPTPPAFFWCTPATIMGS
jgi:hypothetical protein